MKKIYNKFVFRISVCIFVIGFAALDDLGNSSIIFRKPRQVSFSMAGHAFG